MPTDETMTEDQALLAEVVARLQVAGVELADEAPLNEVLRAMIDFLPEAESAVAAESAEIMALRIKAASLPAKEERLRALQAEESAGHGAKLVAAEIARGTIPTDNLELRAAALGLAEADEALFKTTFAAMDPAIETGRVSGGGGGLNKRTRLIAASAREYDRDGVAECGATKRFYVATALADEGEPDLTAAEIQAIEKTR